jgi:hypothetical protein
MIVVANGDSKIWHVEEMILDIFYTISQSDRLEISLNAEGPCAQALGLYDTLDAICDKFNFSKQSITIHTCNQIEYHPEYNIKICPPLYIDVTQQFADTVFPYMQKSIGENLKNFGIFIGRSNWIRLWLASAIQKKYDRNTLMTYHWRPSDDFHSVHIGLDDMLRWNASDTDVNCASEFLSRCPLGLSEPSSYPILSPDHLNICKIYHKFLLEIVCETFYSGASFYPTEKIWRPLLMKTPFIVHGCVNYLKNLRLLGFRTFDQWWSEEYDDYGHDNRICKILDLIEQLSKMSEQQTKLMYLDMKSTLDYNHEVFMNLRSADFQRIFNYD